MKFRVFCGALLAGGVLLTGASWAATNDFNIQATPADLARWMYAFNGSPGSRTTASTFGALGDAPDFDARDAQYLLGWVTSNRVPAGLGASHYAIRKARVTLTISSGNAYAYTGILRDYRSYFPTGDPRHVASGTNVPVELFGAGFRGGFTNAENVYVRWAATNYPQAGPFFSDPSVSQTGPFSSNRVAYAAGFDTNGALVDVSNNVGDDGTNEIAHPFEVAPFAVGQTTNVSEGELMPLRSQLTFDLNLADPLIYQYVQRALSDGDLSVVATAFASGAQGGPVSYPNFYTIFAAVSSNFFPLLDLEGAIIQPDDDSDADGLPDDWENFYLGSLNADGNGNADGDDANNLAEYRAGTDPTNSSSALRVLSLSRTNGQGELHFSFAPDKSYNIDWSPDLQTWHTITNPALYFSSDWLSKAVPNPVYPSPVYAGWRDTAATNQARFYRVETH